MSILQRKDMKQSRKKEKVWKSALSRGITVIFFVSSAPNWIVKLDRDGLLTLKE